jgi:deoxyribonuclease IV
MLFGGHVSIAGGLTKAIERGEEQGFGVIQTFASSPRSFKVNSYSREEITSFNKAFKKSNIKRIFFHAIYLINLASDKNELVEKSVESLVSYMELGSQINCSGTIVHLGSTKEYTFAQKKEQVVSAVNEVLKKSPKDQYLVVENAAGAGNVIGDNLDELVEIYKAVESSRLKFCIDTQHLYASGVDTSSFEHFKDWLEMFDKKIGINNLACIHVNDSKTNLSSSRDRHENIGKGLIGKSGFANILKQPHLQNKPFILEVPGMNGKGPDKENLEILRKLV